MSTQEKLGEIALENGTYETRLTKKFMQRKPYEKHDPRIIKALIPGVAAEIDTQVGKSVKQGDTLATGERFGLIRFGSRVDVYLPAHVVPLVGEGQTAIAGETVLADLIGNEPVARSFRDI